VRDQSRQCQAPHVPSNRRNRRGSSLRRSASDWPHSGPMPLLNGSRRRQPVSASPGLRSPHIGSMPIRDCAVTDKVPLVARSRRVRVKRVCPLITHHLTSRIRSSTDPFVPESINLCRASLTAICRHQKRLAMVEKIGQSSEKKVESAFVGGTRPSLLPLIHDAISEVKDR